MNQTLLCLLRPAVVNCYNDWFNRQVSILRPFLGRRNEAYEHEMEMLFILYNDALESARQIAEIFRWQLGSGNLGESCFASVRTTANTVQYFSPTSTPALFLVLR